jgi:hypothetical protein
MFVEMHHFLNIFLSFNQLPAAAKKDSKNGAFQQTFGPSSFDRALVILQVISPNSES